MRTHKAIPRRRLTTLSLALVLAVAASLVASCQAPTSTPRTTRRVTPPPSRDDTSLGSFRVECELSHRAQVDPIVSPGKASAHLHEFFGNNSTNANSTLQSMRAASTTCTEPGDTAGYWAPALIAPNGTVAKPDVGIFYYRNRPVDYSRTVPFPPDFRMIAGGMDAFPNAYWTCDGESDTGYESRRNYIPDCGDDGNIKMHVFFPSCWDGVHLDSPDHRSHVAYGRDDDGRVEGTDPDTCPPGFPVKLPQLDFRVQYDVSNGRGYRFSDGMVLAHSDFWNTWKQSRLEDLIDECLGYEGHSCKLAEG